MDRHRMTVANTTWSKGVEFDSFRAPIFNWTLGKIIQTVALDRKSTTPPHLSQTCFDLFRAR